MDSPRISINHYADGQRSVVALQGELDVLSVADIRPQVSAAMDQPGGLLMDLREVAYIDSAGLELMVTLRNGLVERQVPFGILVRQGSQPDEVMRIVGLHQVVNIVSDPASAGLEA